MNILALLLVARHKASSPSLPSPFLSIHPSRSLEALSLLPSSLFPSEKSFIAQGHAALASTDRPCLLGFLRTSFSCVARLNSTPDRRVDAAILRAEVSSWFRWTAGGRARETRLRRSTERERERFVVSTIRTSNVVHARSKDFRYFLLRRDDESGAGKLATVYDREK